MEAPKIASMQSLAVDRFGKPESYKILELPVPEIRSPDELLIKVHAASINPVDCQAANGALKMVYPEYTFPYKIGYDVSGVVVAAGSNVPAHLQPGTAVYSRVPENCRGTISDFAISTASFTAMKPSSVSHAQAASIPLAALTVLQGLDRADKYFEGGLKGRTVYIPGGLSGTGSIGVQLAKNVFGAAKVITTLSTSKIAKAESLLGQELVKQITLIDYTKEDPRKVIVESSVDFMFDTMGQGLKSLHLTKKGGLILTIKTIPFGPEFNELASNIPVVVRWILNAIGAVFQYRASRYGVQYHAFFMNGGANDLTRLAKWIDEGKIRPVVGRVTKLNDLKGIQGGCAEVMSGKGGIGKFVIETV